MTVYFPIFAPCRASCLAAFGGIVARLQRVESVRVEKKIDKADIGNAAIVVCPGLERIVCYHDLLEGITGMPKREGLLFALFGGGEGIRRLDVDLPGTSIDDEVYLILSRLMDAVLAVIENHHADVHRISTPDEFAVDDIFHQMGRFCLPEVDPGISETGVGRVVLDRIIEIVSSFDIVSRGFKNQECVLEAVEVFDYGGARRLHANGRLDHVCELGRVGEPGDIAHHHVDYGFKEIGILELVAFHDVLDVDCAVEATEISFLLFGVGHESAFRKPSVAHIFLEYCESVCFRCAKIAVFGKGKGHCLDDAPSTAEFRGDIGDEKLGVGTRDVHIYVRRGAQTAEYAVERDVCRLTVVRMDARKIDAGREHLSASLYLVDEHIESASSLGRFSANVLSEFQRIGEVHILFLFKVDFDDMVFLDTRREKMLLEQIEEQKALPAAPYARYDFYEIAMLSRYQLVEQCFTFDGHELVSSFMFVDYAKKMKPNVVCHNHWADAIAQFQFHEKIQKDESGRRVRRVAAPNAICKEAA